MRNKAEQFINEYKQNKDYQKYQDEFKIKFSRRSGTSLYIIQWFNDKKNEIRISEHNTLNWVVNKANIQITVNSFNEITNMFKNILDEYYQEREHTNSKIDITNLESVMQNSMAAEFDKRSFKKKDNNELETEYKKTNDIELISKLSDADEWWIRHAITKNDNTPIDIIRKMKNDKKWFNNDKSIHQDHHKNKLKYAILNRINNYTKNKIKEEKDRIRTVEIKKDSMNKKED